MKRKLMGAISLLIFLWLGYAYPFGMEGYYVEKDGISTDFEFLLDNAIFFEGQKVIFKGVLKDIKQNINGTSILLKSGSRAVEVILPETMKSPSLGKMVMVKGRSYLKNKGYVVAEDIHILDFRLLYSISFVGGLIVFLLFFSEYKMGLKGFSLRRG